MSLIDLLGRGFGVIEPDPTVLPQSAGPITPETSSPIGCTDPKQQATYIIPASFGSTLLWTVKDQQGNPIEISATPEDGNLTSKYDRIALFHDPFCSSNLYLGSMEADADGNLIVFPHQSVTDTPGIYEMEVHWREPGVNGGEDKYYFNSAVISVEQSLFNRAYTQKHKGPLPLSRIRQKLRDYGTINDSLGFPEFSVEEILSSMLEPIEYYNETPPYVKSYTPANFPFRQRWLEATVSRLLQIGGIWMQRNNVKIQGEGIGGDDRSHYNQMLSLSMQMWNDYRTFVQQEKNGVNITRGFRII